MQMDGFLALTVVCIIFAVGDFFSMKTKAMCSVMFAAAVLFLIGFQTGILPQDIFEVSLLLPVGGILIAFLITHMGTILNLRELLDQWKTLIICATAIAGVGFMMYFMGPLFMDRAYAIASAPVFSGGIVATILMSEAGYKIGRADLAVFAALMFAMQGFVGYPLASFCLRKEAVRLKKQFPGGTALPDLPIEQIKKKRLIPPLPEELRKSYNVLLAKLGIATCLAIWLSSLTGGIVHKYIMCLLVGIVLKEIGFLDDSIMKKANAFGFAIISIMAIVFGNLATASLATLLSLAVPIIIAFLLSLAALIPVSILAGKLLKISPYMSIATASCTMFGFPGDYIISVEVAKSISESEDERKYILSCILPKMLVGGFATVTVGSVIMAGIMASLL